MFGLGLGVVDHLEQSLVVFLGCIKAEVAQGGGPLPRLVPGRHCVYSRPVHFTINITSYLLFFLFYKQFDNCMFTYKQLSCSGISTYDQLS